MAKANKMATEAAAESENDRLERLAARTYLATDKDWDSSGEIEFGGQSDILTLEVGEVGGPFSYIGHQPMNTELGETTVHTATTPDDATIRLPISSSFLRCVDQAGINRGDKFLVRRGEDTVKRNGKGKGQMMQIYSIKVTSRAAAPSASTTR